MAHIADKIEQAVQMERRLRDDLEHLYKKFDAAEERGDELEMQSLDRIMSVKEGLLAEQEERVERLQEQGARETAEVRVMFDDQY